MKKIKFIRPEKSFRYLNDLYMYFEWLKIILWNQDRLILFKMIILFIKKC